jgi:TonB family protein
MDFFFRHLDGVLLCVLLLASPAASQRPPSARPVPRPPDGWQLDTSRSEMTDQPSVLLALNAVNAVEADFRPVLFLRCHEGALDVFIHTGSVLGSENPAGAPDVTAVRIRWGARAAADEVWSRSASYQAAFTADPAAFVRQLLAVPDFRFEFHPFDAMPRVATFNAAGLDRHLPTLKAACPSLEASSDQVFVEAAVDERPEILWGPRLQYPDLLREASIQGRVVVQAIIDTTGRAELRSVKVVQSPNPGFDQPAEDYVRRAVFRPARLHGRAVRVLINLPIDFKIKY